MQLLRGLLIVILVALVVIGLINPNIMMWLWVRVFLAVLLIGILATIAKLLFLNK